MALYCSFCFLLGEGVSSFYMFSLLGAFLAPYSIYLSLLIKNIYIFNYHSWRYELHLIITVGEMSVTSLQYLCASYLSISIGLIDLLQIR